MLQTLTPLQLTSTLSENDLGFSDTSQLTQNEIGWIGQSRAENAARFGLNMPRQGFHLLVLGSPGTGRTSLMLGAIHAAASRLQAAPDFVYLYNFDVPDQPLALRLQAGYGVELRRVLDQFVRQLAKIIPAFLGDVAEQAEREMQPDASSSEAGVEMPAESVSTGETSTEGLIDISANERVLLAVNRYLDEQISRLNNDISARILQPEKFTAFLAALKRDTLENLELFQLNANTETDDLMEGFLSRYRANVLVNHQHASSAPVVYDDDPTFQSLFGGLEGASESGGSAPEFMRLRAGNLLRADGGYLMLHLRDILADQQNGSQILEKLHRFLRNGRVQIEELAGASGHGSPIHLTPEALAVNVKMVVIATREEYYELQNEAPELAGFFRVKVDFSDDFPANAETYQLVSTFIAKRCQHYQLPHFSARAVVLLLRHMQRRLDDQTRFSADFSQLQGLLLESAAVACGRAATWVDACDVSAVLDARKCRHQHPEEQMRRAIVDGELMINVQGRQVGQINGLTHIDLGDASFGSPVRISARCHAGDSGIINIDREVEMTGPNHDKGLFILQSWLAASFSKLTPLSLNASLVFEQEYHGVEGDSASCAELYALVSALSGLALPQGVAITGALNQHGEVMPIGGVNEKIEGFFRVCKDIGLDGTQGVLIPERNQTHLLLDDEVIQAVEQGLFHIHTVAHVLEGLEFLTGMPAGVADESGVYPAESVMGYAQGSLDAYSKIREKNQIGSKPRS